MRFTALIQDFLPGVQHKALDLVVVFDHPFESKAALVVQQHLAMTAMSLVASLRGSTTPVALPLSTWPARNGGFVSCTSSSTLFSSSSLKSRLTYSSSSGSSSPSDFAEGLRKEHAVFCSTKIHAVPTGTPTPNKAATPI
jgi:hypothetical protein